MFIERKTAPAVNNKYYVKTTYGGLNKCIAIDSNGSVLPNCTGYAYGRFMECASVQDCNLSTRDASRWYTTKDGYTRGAIAKRGAVLCFSGGWEDRGHVAIVEEVYDDASVLISQSSYGGVRWEQVRLSYPYQMQGLIFQGFIYNPFVEDIPSKIKMKGCDVSQWNDINHDISMYDFVIIRACSGTSKDTKCEEWRAKCEKLGIPYGAYLYSYALSNQDAIDEANFLCDTVKDWNIQLGLWFDLEQDSYKTNHGFVSSEQWSNACVKFCETVQSRGYYTGVYSSESNFGTLIRDVNFDKWCASWGNNDGTIQRDTSELGTLLQYTSNGGTFDEDISYCDLSHYASYPVKEDDTEPIDTSDDKEITPTPMPSDESQTSDDDYLFKMSNRVYDFLNWLVHITQLVITFYIALAKIWSWPNTDSIIATISACMAFINSILRQSTIGYQKRGGK